MSSYGEAGVERLLELLQVNPIKYNLYIACTNLYKISERV